MFDAAVVAKCMSAVVEFLIDSTGTSVVGRERWRLVMLLHGRPDGGVNTATGKLAFHSHMYPLPPACRQGSSITSSAPGGDPRPNVSCTIPPPGSSTNALVPREPRLRWKTEGGRRVEDERYRA